MIKLLLIILVMWREEENRKKFFEWYAKKNEFDPLVPDNWYRVSIESIMSFKVSFLFLFLFFFKLFSFVLIREPGGLCITTKWVCIKLWWTSSLILELIKPNLWTNVRTSLFLSLPFFLSSFLIFSFSNVASKRK